MSVAPLAGGEPLDERVARLEQEVQELRDTTADRAPFSGVQLGGYGELHYNNLDGSGGAADKEEIDFHRFVLEMLLQHFRERS